MAASDPSLRAVGVSLADVSDWREAVPQGKWSQFFGSLAQRLELTEVIRPQPSRAEDLLNFARSFRPERAAWLARAGFSPTLLSKTNAALERGLASRRGSYDLIVQLQTLCTPRSNSVGSPFVIYTDNTMALTQRFYPQFAPLPEDMLRHWLAFEARVCRDAGAVFTFSEFARTSVIDDYGCSPHQVHAVGAGANQLVSSLDGKDYTQPRALFVGRPFAPKGGKVLLDAWTAVRAAIPSAELIVVGPKHDPAPRAGAGITWLGRLGRVELAREYRQASVFVLPSLFDAWGHVFVEAMGHGLPCIGTDCCAMPEIIDDRRSGLLVPRGEPEPLAAALIALLGDPGRAESMGRAGYARVRDSLTWDHVTARVVSHLPGLSA